MQIKAAKELWCQAKFPTSAKFLTYYCL